MLEMHAHFQPNQQSSAQWCKSLRDSQGNVACNKIQECIRKSCTTLAARVVELSFPRNSWAELSTTYNKKYQGEFKKLSKLLYIIQRIVKAKTSLIIWCDLELFSFSEVSPILLWAVRQDKGKYYERCLNSPITQETAITVYLHTLRAAPSNGSGPLKPPL